MAGGLAEKYSRLSAEQEVDEWGLPRRPRLGRWPHCTEEPDTNPGMAPRESPLLLERGNRDGGFNIAEKEGLVYIEFCLGS